MPKTKGFELREATKEDSFYVSQLAHQLVKETNLKEHLGFDWKATAAFAEQVVDNPSTCLFVAVDGGEIVGFVAGMLTQTFFNPSKVQAAELGWYVEKTHRNSKIASDLHKMYEEWATNSGASVVHMMHMNTDQSEAIEKMYGKWGYSKTETAYMKEV